jgi:hypothetical protein
MSVLVLLEEADEDAVAALRAAQRVVKRLLSLRRLTSGSRRLRTVADWMPVRSARFVDCHLPACQRFEEPVALCLGP